MATTPVVQISRLHELDRCLVLMSLSLLLTLRKHADQPQPSPSTQIDRTWPNLLKIDLKSTSEEDTDNDHYKMGEERQGGRDAER